MNALLYSYSFFSRCVISIGTHMGLSAIKKNLHGNRQLIARGEAECNLGLL